MTMAARGANLKRKTTAAPAAVVVALPDLDVIANGDGVKSRGRGRKSITVHVCGYCGSAPRCRDTIEAHLLCPGGTCACATLGHVPDVAVRSYQAAYCGATVEQVTASDPGLDPTNTKQQEKLMSKQAVATATTPKDKAEAMTLDDLRKRLGKLKVTGASKMNKAAAVTAFVKASTATTTKAKTSTTKRVDDGLDVRALPYVLEWTNADGSFVGKSPKGDWGNSRYSIKNYLDTTKAKAEDIRSALTEALASIRAGKSTKALDVKITVTPRA